MLYSNNPPEENNSPASMNPCLISSFEHAVVTISGRAERKSIKAFFFVYFNDKLLGNDNLQMFKMHAYLMRMGKTF